MMANEREMEYDRVLKENDSRRRGLARLLGMSEGCTWRELLDATDLMVAGKEEAENKVEDLLAKIEETRVRAEDPEIRRIREGSVNQTIHHVRSVGIMAGMCAGYASCFIVFSPLMETTPYVKGLMVAFGVLFMFAGSYCWRAARDVRFPRSAS
jgi:hypothetical protein